MSQGFTKGIPIDTDNTLSANSNLLVPSQNAVKTYAAPKTSPTFTGTITTPAIIVSSETALRVAIIDASKNVKSSSTTTTQLGYLDVTSSVQTQLDNRVKTIYRTTTPTSALTGTLVETQMATFSIPANTLASNDYLRLVSLFAKKTVNTAATSYRIRINSSNNFATATLIATFTISTTGNYLQGVRNWMINSGNIIGISNVALGSTDITAGTSAYSSTAIDVTNIIYVFISAVQSASGDSTTIEGIYFTN
tara:strand:+ start:88 stop:840 length:753 start_codon:yes stop_codon:yes gene_type:complete